MDRHSKLMLKDENPLDDENSNMAILLDNLIGASKSETHTTIEFGIFNSWGQMAFQTPFRSRTCKKANKYKRDPKTTKPFECGTFKGTGPNSL